jgi:hypothetical protein
MVSFQEDCQWRARDLAQLLEHLPSMPKTLGSIPSTVQTKKKKKSAHGNTAFKNQIKHFDNEINNLSKLANCN